MVSVSAEVLVCTDCLFAIEYDELPDDRPDLKESISNSLETNQFYVAGDSEEEIEFSYSRCEACGNTDAGLRHQMFIMER